MKVKYGAFIAFSFSVLSGCASKPTEIQAQYVSPLQYQSYDCDQVSAELMRISRKSTQLYGQLDKTASNDQAQMAVGLILFWPTLFFLEGGDGAEAAEYARLKGEFDALEQVAIQKKCNMGQFAAIHAQAAGSKEIQQQIASSTYQHDDSSGPHLQSTFAGVDGDLVFVEDIELGRFGKAQFQSGRSNETRDWRCTIMAENENLSVVPKGTPVKILSEKHYPERGGGTLYDCISAFRTTAAIKNIECRTSCDAYGMESKLDRKNLYEVFGKSVQKVH